jgi:hypothetical protein
MELAIQKRQFEEKAAEAEQKQKEAFREQE